MTVVPNNVGTDYFSAFRNFMALGTGAGEPVATQSALVAEVLRTSSAGGFASSASTVVDAPNNRLIGSFGITRVYDFTASYNLTEVGFSELSTGAINFRDLFRDGLGNAITVSVQSGQQLQMTHTLKVAIPYGSNIPTTVNIAGLGNLPGKHTFFGVGSTLLPFQSAFLPASPNGAIYVRPMSTANSGSETALGGSVLNGTNSPNALMDAYVTGSYKRTKTAIWTTSMTNQATYGWVFCSLSPGDNSNPTSGYKVTLDAPFTKTATNKLTLIWELSISRGIA